MFVFFFSNIAQNKYQMNLCVTAGITHFCGNLTSAETTLVHGIARVYVITTAAPNTHFKRSSQDTVLVEQMRKLVEG